MIRVKGFDLRCGGKRRHGRKRPLIEEHEAGSSQLRSDKGTGRPVWGSLFLGPSEGIRPALRRRPPRVAKRPRRFAKSPRVRIPQIQVKTPTSPKGIAAFFGLFIPVHIPVVSSRVFFLILRGCGVFLDALLC